MTNEEEKEVCNTITQLFEAYSFNYMEIVFILDTMKFRYHKILEEIITRENEEDA